MPERESIITINSDPWKGEIIKHWNYVIYCSDPVDAFFGTTNQSRTLCFFKKMRLHFSPPIGFGFFMPASSLGGNCRHAPVMLWVSWFIQPKISPPFSFHSYDNIIFNQILKRRREIFLQRWTHLGYPHHSCHNATSPSHTKSKRTSKKKNMYIFFSFFSPGNMATKKNIYSPSSCQIDDAKTREDWWRCYPLDFFFKAWHLNPRAYFLRRRIDKIDGKKKKGGNSRTKNVGTDTIATGQTWNRWHVNWHRHTACHTQHTWCHLSISREPGRIKIQRNWDGILLLQLEKETIRQLPKTNSGSQALFFCCCCCSSKNVSKQEPDFSRSNHTLMDEDGWEISNGTSYVVVRKWRPRGSII